MNKIFVLFQHHIGNNIQVGVSSNKAVLEKYVADYKEFVEYMSHRAQEDSFKDWDEQDWRMDGFNLPEFNIVEVEINNNLQFNVDDVRGYLYMSDKDLKKHITSFLNRKK